jgi:drug/metabolite transporter (DMT)-like permease
LTDSALGHLLAALSLLSFTAAILLTRIASSRLPLSLGFLVATSVNVVFAALALAAQLVLRGEGVQWNWPALALFAGAGCFSTWLGRWFFYESVVRFGPARASIFQVSSPLFTALIAWLFLGERLAPGVLIGMAFTIMGLALVGGVFKAPTSHKTVAMDLAPGRMGQRDPNVALPAPRGRMLHSMLVLGTISSLAYAIGNLLRGSAVRAWNEPILGALAGAVLGLLLQLAFSTDKSTLGKQFKNASRSGLGFFALIGVATISGQILSIGAMRYIPLSVAAVVTLCTPLLVFPLSRLLFKNQEPMSTSLLAGSAMTLIGIAVIVLR